MCKGGTVKITHIGSIPEPGLWYYRCKCSCGWQSKRRRKAGDAFRDQIVHISTAPKEEPRESSGE